MKDKAQHPWQGKRLVTPSHAQEMYEKLKPFLRLKSLVVLPNSRPARLEWRPTRPNFLPTFAQFLRYYELELSE